MSAVTLTPNVQHGTRRRTLLNASLKTIDITVGLVALLGGVFALVATPPTILREVSLPFLVVLWGCLLIVGGFGAALGRLTGIWIIETTGIVAAAFGILIYLVVASSVIQTEFGVIVAVSMILIAELSLLRRYIDLQLFLAEPTDKNLIVRLREILRIRTARRAALEGHRAP